MTEYALVATAAVSVFGVTCAERIANYMQKKLPRKYKSAAKLVALLSVFMSMAFGIADIAIAIHQSGAPSIYFLPVLIGSIFFYVRYFMQNLRKIRAKTWQFWFKYVFVISCFALAPTAYFLLAFSILELQYNTTSWF